MEQTGIDRNGFDLILSSTFGQPDQNQGIKKFAYFAFVVRRSIHLSYGRAFFPGLPSEALATNYAFSEDSLVKKDGGGSRI